MEDLLVGDEDAERRDELRKRHALVLQPVLVGSLIVDEDNEVVVGSLVVELALGSLAACHVGLWCRVTGCFRMV